MEEILLNIETKEMRCAHLKNGQLNDLVIERKKERRLTGNIYRGHVRNILLNIQSAFLDIGEGDNGFIHISDVVENANKIEQIYDMEFETEGEEPEPEVDLEIDKVLKIDQPVLVQVVKEPIGTKGARLTANVSIAGRYLVLLPNSSHRGVSRKIEARQSRDRLKKLIRQIELPQGIGLICRTASAQASQEALIDEAQELYNTWQHVIESYQSAKGPGLLYAESDLIKRSLLTAMDKKIDRLLVDDYASFQILKRLFAKYKDSHPLRIEFYRDKIPMFERFNVEREIERSLRRKIWLPSGGYLFFDKTEAMYTIDVNSGRSSVAESNVEESLVRINMEAAEEIARQLRIRNVGGLIICDFIDMRHKKSQRRVMERLKECMRSDFAKCTILGMSEFGLVEMTRQRSRGSLLQTIFSECPYCHGSGTIKNYESVSIEIERSLKKAIQCNQQFGLKLVTHPAIDTYLGTIDKDFLFRLAERNHAQLVFDTNDSLHLNDFEFWSTVSGQRVEV